MKGKSGVEFSVVMPTYNRERYIGGALRSVLDHSGSDVEVLVVDDCSTDDTEEVVRGLAEESGRVVYHRNQTNVGASDSRNAGIELAEGRYIVFLDSDDLLVPGHLDQARAAFTRSDDLGIFFCDSFILKGGAPPDPNGDTWVRRNSAIYGYEIDTGPRELADVFTFSTSFPGMTVDRRVFDRIGGLRQEWFPVDDVEFTIRAAAAGFGLYYLHRPLAYYRVHGGNASGVAQMVRTCEKKVALLRRTAGDHPDLSRVAGARRRLAEAELELGMAAYLEGRYLRAVGPTLRALIRHPPLMGALARRARRRMTSPAGPAT